MKLLNARYASGAAFLEHYQDQFSHGGLVVPTRAQVAIGDEAMVVVRFPELQGEVCLRGFVAWRRSADPRRRIKGGVGVEFVQSDRRWRDALLSIARGDAKVDAKRRHRRIPIELRVGLRLDRARPPLEGAIENISRSGVFVRCPETAAPGTGVVMSIELPDSRSGPIELSGKVVHVRDSQRRRGMGIMFRFSSAGAVRRIAEIVRRLESKL